MIGAPVYAELFAHPKATEALVSNFISDTGIVLDFELDQQVWLEVGHRFAHYAKRRRRSAPEGPKRLLADLIIGSHALANSDRLKR